MASQLHELPFASIQPSAWYQDVSTTIARLPIIRRLQNKNVCNIKRESNSWQILLRLVTYLLLNIGLTMSNKKLLLEYPYPWLLTAFHALSSAFGTYFVQKFSITNASRRVQPEVHHLLFFSILYTVNIAVSNVSLGLVNVPLHQAVRATTPLFTVLICAICFKKLYHPATYLCLVPIITGVALSVEGSFSLTSGGVWFLILGAQLAAAKTIFANRLQTVLNLNALDIIYYVSPLAGIQASIWAYMNGEVDMFLVKEISGGHLQIYGVMLLGLNGVLALGLNWSSFTTNKVAGALSMAIVGNLKQAATIGLSLVCFSTPYVLMDIFGISLTLWGSFLYALVEFSMPVSERQD